MDQRCLTEELLSRLFAAYEPNYDVQRHYEFAGRTFSGYAELRFHGGQFVFAKKARLWEADAFDYVFFQTVKSLSEDTLHNLVSFMTGEALEKVQPRPDHMTSYLTLVVIADEVDEEARRAVKRTRFRKNYRMGLHGWSDLRIVVADISQGDVLANGQGKVAKAAVESALAHVLGAHGEMKCGPRAVEKRDVPFDNVGTEEGL